MAARAFGAVAALATLVVFSTQTPAMAQEF
jgi:hypothetical protein